MGKFNIEVVAGIIYNAERDKVLIAKRANLGDAANLWEFPGGKRDLDETLEAALIRELNEELGIEASEPQFYQTLSEISPEKHLTLHFFEVFNFKGKPSCLEQQQELRWLPVSCLSRYAFPKLNAELITKLMSSHDK